MTEQLDLLEYLDSMNYSIELEINTKGGLKDD